MLSRSTTSRDVPSESFVSSRATHTNCASLASILSPVHRRARRAAGSTAALVCVHVRHHVVTQRRAAAPPPRRAPHPMHALSMCPFARSVVFVPCSRAGCADVSKHRIRHRTHDPQPRVQSDRSG
eukprot:3524472-Prymnesium_polylepis.1